MKAMRNRPALLFSIVALAWVTGCGRQGTKSGPANPKLVALIPGDTIAIVGGRMEPLRKAGLVPPLDKMAAETGFNPATDLDEFLLAYNGKSAALLATGRFDATKLTQKLEQAGAKAEKHAGTTIWSNGEQGVALVSSDLAVAAPNSMVRAILDRKVGLNPSLGELLQGLPGDATVWAVSAGGIALPIPERSNLANLEKILSQVESLVAFANVASGVRASATATSVDDAAAKQLHDGLRGLLGLARLTTPKERTDLLKIYDAIDIRQQGRQTRVNAYLGSDDVNRLLDFARSR
jgi:hypothetical protein